MAYQDDGRQSKTWIKIDGDFKAAKDLQQFLDNLDIDFGDDSRLVAKFSRKRGMFVIKEPIPFDDLEADQIIDILMRDPYIDHVGFESLSESL